MWPSDVEPVAESVGGFHLALSAVRSIDTVESREGKQSRSFDGEL